MSNLTPLSSVQNLGATQTTPRIQTVSLSVKPGLLHTIKTVGTALYVSACYYLDESGSRISTAASVAMNTDSAFLVEAGTQIEFEVFDGPFNELHFSALADVETFLEVQIAYMLRVKNSSGGAGTASDMAHFQAQLSELQNELALVNETLAGKQDVLTFDNVPVNGSANPVKSDGIYDELQKRLPCKWWTGDGKNWWQPDVNGRILNFGNISPIHGIQKLTFDGGFESLFQKDKTGTLAFLSDLDALRTQILSLIGGVLPVALEYDVPATASTLQIPFDDEENGEISVAAIGGDFLTANESGEIQIESL